MDLFIIVGIWFVIVGSVLCIGVLLLKLNEGGDTNG